MRTGDVADGMLLRLLGPGVDYGDDTRDTGLLEGGADEVVELAGAVIREDGASVRAFVALQDLNGRGREVYLDYTRALSFVLEGTY